jgi:hydrogenase maturation protein HypF
MQIKKIKLPFEVRKPTLSLGTQTKNTVCLAKGSFALLSPVHADLSNPCDFLSFKKAVEYFLKAKPSVIAYDLHPEYQSTKYALQLSAVSATKLGGPAKIYGGNYQLSAVQHHHAHIAACMAENALQNQKVIGVAFDGTGLGTDELIWGAEFLICDYKNFKRKAHLKELPLLGANRAILEPWRLAAFWLSELYGEEFLNLDIAFTKGIKKDEWQVLKKMYLTNFNSPQASSMGRLFDAVGSLVLAKYKVRFEAQLAIELEKLATRYLSPARSYPFKIIKTSEGFIIDPANMFKQIVTGLKSEEKKEKIAYCFHLTAAEMIKKVCLLLRKETGIKKVVFSGGVFQNKLLLTLSSDLLYKQGFQVFRHKILSCSDSSISLGQAVAA